MCRIVGSPSATPPRSPWPGSTRSWPARRTSAASAPCPRPAATTFPCSPGSPWTIRSAPHPRHPETDPRDDLPLDLVVPAAEREDDRRPVAAFQFPVQDGPRTALLERARRAHHLHQPGVRVPAGLGAVDLDGGGVLREE